MESLPPARRQRVWPWVAVPVVVAIGLAVTMVPVPYYVDSPGLVRATQPLVSVEGHRSFTSKGAVMFTTVSEQRATPALLLRAWLDDSIDVVDQDVAVPGGDRKRQRRVEQAMMDRSKLTSLQVAFEVLDLPLRISGSGAFVNEVREGFPAVDVITPGDVITAVDGAPVSTVTDLSPLLKERPVGDEVTVTLRRHDGSGSQDVTVRLGADEQDTSHGFLGVIVSTADEQVDPGFDIELDSGSVIGPSAGLAWTLGVIDRLSPGDLTHGRKVAVTGTIAPDGTVGPIGGIAQKIVGAKKAGATLFLYPESTSSKDVRRLRELAGDDITLHPVATVHDALEVLDPNGLGAT